jgi:hypothetical protein
VLTLVQKLLKYLCLGIDEEVVANKKGKKNKTRESVTGAA